MKRRRGSRSPSRRPARPPGTSPDALHIDPDAPFPEIRVVSYGPDSCVEKRVGKVSELRPFLDAGRTVWVNVDGLGDEATLRELGSLFGLHRLALEDVVHLGQRPKVEPYDDYLFIVARMARPEEEGATEQLSMILGRGFLLTVQEQAGDCFEGVRERLRFSGTTIRRSGSDYLAYALLDAVIDAYFPVLERIRDRLETLEVDVLTSPDSHTVLEIHDLKQHLQSLRRAITPHREAINVLLRDSADFVSADTAIHLRDCYDHLLRLTELAEVYREQCSDLMSTYLSMVSNRMNEVMKVLTIIATIFIPLSFVAGLYGMNFNPEASRWNMPELNWPLGYPFALALMAAVAGGLVAYVWRRGWFR